MARATEVSTLTAPNERNAPSCSYPVSLHREQHGSGVPLLLAHGFAGSARNFLPQVRREPLNCRVHLYDARGHARSEAPTSANAYVWDCFISDFDAIFHEALGERPSAFARKAIVGGLSFGAATALLWALKNQSLISGLVLAAYPESNDDMRSWSSRFADAIDEKGLDAAGDEFVWGPTGRFGGRDACAVRRGFLQHSPHAIAAILRHSMAVIPQIESLSEALVQLRVATLVVVGSEDQRSLEASRKIVDMLPNATLAIIDEASHVVNLSSPERFNQVLANFVRNCS